MWWLSKITQVKGRSSCCAAPSRSLRQSALLTTSAIARQHLTIHMYRSKRKPAAPLRLLWKASQPAINDNLCSPPSRSYGMAVMLPTWIGSLFLLLCSADGSHHRQPYTYPQLVSDSKGHDMVRWDAESGNRCNHVL